MSQWKEENKGYWPVEVSKLNSVYNLKIETNSTELGNNGVQLGNNL